MRPRFSSQPRFGYQARLNTQWLTTGNASWMLNRALSCELGHSRRNGTRSWPRTDQCLHVRLQCSGRPNRSRTNGDAATNDIAPAIYCMHVHGVFLLRGQGAMGDGFHACQVIVTVSVWSCQRFSDRDWAKPHSPLHTPWP